VSQAWWYRGATSSGPARAVGRRSSDRYPRGGNRFRSSRHTGSAAPRCDGLARGAARAWVPRAHDRLEARAHDASHQSSGSGTRPVPVQPVAREPRWRRLRLAGIETVSVTVQSVATTTRSHAVRSVGSPRAPGIPATAGVRSWTTRSLAPDSALPRSRTGSPTTLCALVHARSTRIPTEVPPCLGASGGTDARGRWVLQWNGRLATARTRAGPVAATKAAGRGSGTGPAATSGKLLSAVPSRVPPAPRAPGAPS
jgi:hypothetical protein